MPDQTGPLTSPYFVSLRQFKNVACPHTTYFERIQSLKDDTSIKWAARQGREAFSRNRSPYAFFAESYRSSKVLVILDVYIEPVSRNNFCDFVHLCARSGNCGHRNLAMRMNVILYTARSKVRMKRWEYPGHHLMIQIPWWKTWNHIERRRLVKICLNLGHHLRAHVSEAQTYFQAHASAYVRLGVRFRSIQFRSLWNSGGK